MEKWCRLRKNADFQRARRQGQSWANKLLVLNVAPNGLDHNRFGFSVSRWVGKAVARNRARRLMREAVRRQRDRMPIGWDVIWIARLSMREVDFSAVERAVEQLLRRAHLLQIAGSKLQEAKESQKAGKLLNPS